VHRQRSGAQWKIWFLLWLFRIPEMPILSPCSRLREQSAKMAAIYTRKALQKKLAGSGMALISMQDGGS
jgi:hypothetical protein